MMSTSTISHYSETPAEGQQVITACAFIHQTIGGVEKVFLPKRADTKKFLPGVYELPGGHIDFGEDPVTGLKREIQEEFGMDIEVGEPFFVFTYNNDVKRSHSIEVIYSATFKNDVDKLTLNPEDHSEFGWFAEDELEKATSAAKASDDIEFQAMRKGFALLRSKAASFENLLQRATAIRNRYDKLNNTKRGITWNEQDFMAGFVGDVGDLSKIIMAKHGLRDIDDIDAKLVHELADCLWCVLVLADAYKVDLVAAFQKTMDELDKRIATELVDRNS